MSDSNTPAPDPTPERPHEQHECHEQTYLRALYALMRSEKVLFTQEELDEIKADPVTMDELMRRLAEIPKANA